MPNQDMLVKELRRIASALVDPAERRGRGVRRLIGRTPDAECQDKAAYFHFALVAAFDAFVALGGSADDPTAFPWAERRDQLTEWARKRLVSDMQGAHTNFGDRRARRTPRERLPRLRWDVWGRSESRMFRKKSPAADGGANWHLHRLGFEDAALASLYSGGMQSPWMPDRASQQERDLEMAELDSLLAAVRSVLREYECWVLYEHYFRGRTLRDIAQDVVAGRCPELRYKCKRNYGEGPAGIRRAEKQVQQTLQRALARAGQRLGTEWRHKGEDVACD